MQDKLLKPYKGFSINKSWKEYSDGSKHNIIYTASIEENYGVFDAAKTLAELKRKIDIYKRQKWSVFGEYGGHFSNLKDARKCAKEASKTKEYDYEASIFNGHDGFYYIDYRNGKCIRDGWTIKRKK